MTSRKSLAYPPAVRVLSLVAIFICGGVRLRSAEMSERVEWTMDLGCRHCHFAEQTGVTVCKANCGPAAMKDGKVYTLTGSVPKDFKKGGTWMVKGSLSEDQKTVVVSEMSLQEAKEDEGKNEPPLARSPEAKAFRGAAAHTGAGLPTLTSPEGTRFSLKPAHGAPASARDLLTRIGGGAVTGIVEVFGTTYEDDTHHWIVVEAISLPPTP